MKTGSVECTANLRCESLEMSLQWYTHTPPCTFTRLGSRSINLMLANTTTEKASLISQRAMSSFLNPQCSRTLLIAATGAVGKSMGTSTASPNPGGGGGVVIPLSNNFLAIPFHWCAEDLHNKWICAWHCFQVQVFAKLVHARKKCAHVHTRTCMRVVPAA